MPDRTRRLLVSLLVSFADYHAIRLLEATGDETIADLAWLELWSRWWNAHRCAEEHGGGPTWAVGLDESDTIALPVLDHLAHHTEAEA